MSKFLLRLSPLFLLVSASGCASIDFDYPKSESFALTDTADTYIGRGVAEVVSQHPPEQSGFYPVYDGIDSLALRLLMAERAERSIDAQYFLIHNDLVGMVFANSLLKAANRGVRVRLLVDDILTKGLDSGLATLDSHENIEIRLFNPFGHRTFRALDAPSLGRVTRRMHNKSFTVDNWMTLIGGRNIGDEYFDARKDEKFGDLDVLAIGSIVNEVSYMFDAYWNHQAAMPIPVLADVPDDAEEALARLVERGAEALKDVEVSKYADAVKSSVLQYVQTDASAFTWAEYEFVYDSPDKIRPDADDAAQKITTDLRASIIDAEEELFVVTPYFVLLPDNIEGFRRLRDRNINITVLTNSLAANNHTSVHSGYAPIRKPLLEMGVKLYELRANAQIPADESAGVQHAKTTLHAKTFAVDRKRIFIGSFNWNQRSAHRDTEAGVIIHSPQLAAQMVELVSAALPIESFEVFLNEDNKLRWRTYENGEEVIVAKEPQSGFWRRFNASFMRVLPIESQL